MLHRTLACTAVLSAILALPAPAQVGDFTGQYTLVEVAGEALPVVVDTGNDCREELTEATLHINTDGTWRIIGQLRETCGTQVRTGTEEEDGEYTIAGTELRFDDLDDLQDDAGDSDIDWEDLGTGSREGERLRVRIQDGRTDLIFVPQGTVAQQ